MGFLLGGYTSAQLSQLIVDNLKDLKNLKKLLIMSDLEISPEYIKKNL